MISSNIKIKEIRIASFKVGICQNCQPLEVLCQPPRGISEPRNSPMGTRKTSPFSSWSISSEFWLHPGCCPKISGNASRRGTCLYRWGASILTQLPQSRPDHHQYANEPAYGHEGEHQVSVLCSAGLFGAPGRAPGTFLRFGEAGGAVFRFFSFFFHGSGPFSAATWGRRRCRW